ncbi:hypothetical protein BCPG3_009 [Bacillus phage BCPG3]|uniref:Uncharacterized protein n=2 Tax=Wphvirus BPS13 TaxID=1987727 RepID=A0A173GB58_9CAUD|nr:hypothetical protein BPS13_0252 [Bacillus phage BPS13]YP_009282049.1 hypothetical protein SALINJAH_95 [Bacillus phage SalinJah]QQO38756.1 hypothetical protein BCPG1_024 [Bacillus phage BCPG1]QSJ04326.1 hypothetical protein BCPG3_009 [Bacillus phage BCPG3]QSJ04539.1 hypothetical protein BCP18_007 [Bacillus phage BCP18]AEZ50431.1 hypothetical protein BPS13_0252 [Bacillus phage BPS13]ANH50562.1 hypothetical protein SALINJAH_95 [Bacillus phage SalinJah]
MSEFNASSFLDSMLEHKDATIKEQISKIIDLEWKNRELEYEKKALQDSMKYISKVCGAWIGLSYQWMKEAEDEEKHGYYRTEEEIQAEIDKYYARAKALKDVRNLIKQEREARDF